jgi:aspartyl-tRNA(Asn)/glutamyl-tRNA(Gln) amidotransferase subunit C
MAIDKQQVEKIAHLARIALDDDSASHYATELSKILDLVEQMNQVDTNNIEPMAHPLDAVARLREDVVTEIDQRDYFQRIAPRTEAGLYLVPKVIE